MLVLDEKLDITEGESETALIGLIENRLPVDSLKALMRAGLTDAEVYQLIIPRRTLAHRTARKEPLSQDESDRALRLARIIALAEQAFGEPERAMRWLRKSKTRLNGRTPMDVLATEAGGRFVEEWLWQIDDGMAA